MAALAQVKTRVTVVAGQAEASVGEILALQAGSVLPLEAAVNSPFDVVLNGATIARGELVAIGDRYGICITEVAKSS
jgi:flagellar motor switch protein FliN/FliY